jgi:hypothetical protein
MPFTDTYCAQTTLLIAFFGFVPEDSSALLDLIQRALLEQDGVRVTVRRILPVALFDIPLLSVNRETLAISVGSRIAGGV